MTTVSTSKPNQQQQQSFVTSFIIQQNKKLPNHSRESSADSLNLITSSSSSSSEQQNLSDMPYIYKQPAPQQQQQPLNKKQLYINTTPNNKISQGTFTFNQNNNLQRKDSIETLDSISSTNSIKLLTTPNKNTSSSSSSSSVSSTTAVKYDYYEPLIMSQINNNSNNTMMTNNSTIDDDLDFLPSPTSSGIPTSPSVLSFLSTSSTTLTPLANASASAGYIPTRYTDRRVSTSAIQPDPYRFNVNYSEAGSHLARSAQEQLKIAEQIKEAKKEAQRQAAIAAIKSTKDNSSENVGEDWQNVSDFNNSCFNWIFLSGF